MEKLQISNMLCIGNGLHLRPTIRATKVDV